MFRKKIVVIILVVLVSLPASHITALQGGDCETWRALAYSIFDRYNDVKDNKTIETVADIQALRRELDQFDIATCPTGQELYHDMSMLLNLSSDSIVAGLIGDITLAAGLSIQVSEVYMDVVEGIGGGAIPVASITEPTGDTVNSYHITVKGDYDPEQLGDDDLWLFVMTPQLSYFPQIVEGCDPSKRSPVALMPGRNTWAASVYLGTETLGIGDTFDIILMRSGDEGTQYIYDYFDTACAPNSYPGFSAGEVYGGLFEEITYVTVTRTQ